MSDDERTFRALRDVVSGGKAIKAESTFKATPESVEQALAFGLVEAVKDKPKPTATRKTTKR